MRKMTYDPERRKVKLEYSPDMCLYEYSLSEVMLRPNTRPFFIFAESNSGKTVIGVDMFVKAMSSGVFNQFQYITGTYNGEGNTYLRNKVLKACCFQPNNSTELIRRMTMIVNTLKKEIDKKISNDDIIKFVKNDMINTSTISGELKTYLQNLEQRLAAKYQAFKTKNPYESVVRLIFDSSATSQRIFMNVYKQQNFDQFITTYNSNVYELQKEIEASGQLQVMIENKQISKSKALNNLSHKMNKCYKEYKDEELRLYKVLIKKEFEHLTKDESSKQKILQYFQNQNQANLLDEYTRNICEYIQDPFRACIIIDDVSGQIQQLQESKERVDPYNKQAKTLYTEVMGTILTQGRHVGNFFIALHNPDNLPSSVRQQMGNIVLNPQAKGWLNTSRNFAQEKNLIMDLLREIEIYNNENGKKYNLIYFKEKSESPDPDCQFCLMQAEYIESQKFDSAQYQNNKYFKYLVDHQDTFFQQNDGQKNGMSDIDDDDDI